MVVPPIGKVHLHETQHSQKGFILLGALKLRTTEADKVRCGQRHFEALGVPFGVAVTADEV